MLKVKVNEKEFSVVPDKKVFKINKEEVRPDIVRISDSECHLLLKTKSYRVSIIENNGKELVLEINGNRYSTAVKDQYDLLLETLGMDAALTAKAEDVKAPMPGLVLEILVKPEDEIEKGMPLIILEAMKMENVIKANASAKVQSIKVKAKDAVEKGQVLITFY